MVISVVGQQKSEFTTSCLAVVNCNHEPSKTDFSGSFVGMRDGYNFPREVLFSCNTKTGGDSVCVANYLKLSYLKWSQWPGLNRRPTVYETVALPLSYIGFPFFQNEPVRGRFHRTAELTFGPDTMIRSLAVKSTLFPCRHLPRTNVQAGPKDSNAARTPATSARTRVANGKSDGASRV